MSPSNFDPATRVEVDRRGRQLNVYVAGDLDIATAEDFSDEVVGHITPGVEMIWLDMSNVSFCDSTGLAALVRIQRRASSQDSDIALCGATEALRRTVEATGLDGILHLRARQFPNDGAV